jgi:hypothetical protein
MVALAVERIFWGANEQKTKRFAAVVASTVAFGTKTQELEDAASYIHALDELSEDDIRVLKHLYNHQKNLVAENHSIQYNEFFQDGRMRKLLEGAAELGMQMDEFYARCGRLSGYGLVLPLERRPDTVRTDQFAFRITLLGRRLVDMLVKVGKETTDVTKKK